MAKGRGDRGLFQESLALIPEAIKWAEEQDVKRLRRFLVDNANIPLYCFGSGGAYSPLEYIVQLYESNRAMAKAMTPLAISSLSDEALKSAKVLFLSDTGKGLDEEYVLEHVAKVNPKGLCAITYDKGDGNDVVKIVKDVTHNWFSYSWLTQGNTFISTVSTTCLYALIYKAFTNTPKILNEVTINLEPANCYTYKPRVSGNIPDIQDIQNYIVLYNGWSKPVAIDFESKMVESGIASVQLCDYRNFCHGRFIFLSNHLEDSTLVLFISRREKEYVRQLILEGKNFFGEELFPLNTPIITIETNYDSPLATIDLLVKMSVCFSDIAKAFGIEPCSPPNPYNIDKRVPRSIQFEKYFKPGSLSGIRGTGRNGSIKGVDRKKVIYYDPNKSVEQLAKSNGVSIPTIRKFIQDKHIDRMRDDRMIAYNTVWIEYIQDSEQSVAAIARKLKMSPNTVKHYLSIEAKDIMPEEGKTGMVSEHPIVNKLREVIAGLQKRFEQFCLIRQRVPDLAPGEYLKKLLWSDDKKGKNQTLVISFIQMKEFKYKFKDKEIELIHNN